MFCKFVWISIDYDNSEKFKPYQIRFTLSLIILFSFSTFIYSQNPESLSNDEQTLDKKLSHLKTEILTNAEKR